LLSLVARGVPSPYRIGEALPVILPQCSKRFGGRENISMSDSAIDQKGKSLPVMFFIHGGGGVMGGGDDDGAALAATASHLGQVYYI